MSVLAFTVVGCSDSMSPAAPSSMQSVTEEARGGDAQREQPGGEADYRRDCHGAENIGSSARWWPRSTRPGWSRRSTDSRQFTVFAPTNDGLRRGGQGVCSANDEATGMDLIEALDVATLTAGAAVTT